MRRRFLRAPYILAAAAAAAAILSASVVAASNGGQGHTPVTLCHFVPAHGGSYIVITVDDDGSSGNANLQGHAGHENDIIPAPADGCPTGEVAAPTNTSPAGATATPTDDDGGGAVNTATPTEEGGAANTATPTEEGAVAATNTPLAGGAAAATSTPGGAVLGAEAAPAEGGGAVALPDTGAGDDSTGNAALMAVLALLALGGGAALGLAAFVRKH